MIIKKRFYLYLALFSYVNIPTIIVELRYFYKWGNWYGHEPVGYLEKFYSRLFQAAGFIMNTIGQIWPILINIVLLVPITLHIVKFIKNNSIPNAKKAFMILLLLILFIITILSFDTIMFLPIFWI